MARQNDTTDAEPQVPLPQWYAPGVVEWRSVHVPSDEWTRLVTRLRRIDTAGASPPLSASR